MGFFDRHKELFSTSRKGFSMGLILAVMVAFILLLAFDSADKNLELMSNGFGSGFSDSGYLEETQKQVHESFFMFSPVFYIPFLLLLLGIVAIEMHRKLKEKKK
ncbi:MAG: hypothetical protein J7K00_04200 [Candidatus Diapherotrites archaeon]|nr:hypothetical protein [Candidatus Diapherotrites archaeon]